MNRINHIDGLKGISTLIVFFSHFVGAFTCLSFLKNIPQLSGEILPQRKLPRTVTLRNISSEIGLIKYIFDVASFEEDLTNRV